MKINLKKSKDTPYPIRQIENLRDLIDSSGAIFYCEKNIFLSIILKNAPVEYFPIFKGACIVFCDGFKYIIKNMQEAKIIAKVDVRY